MGRFVGSCGIVALFALVVYGGLSAFVFKFLPERIARAEKLERGFREVLGEVHQDERTLRDCLTRSGVAVAKDVERRREDYRRMLRDPAFVDLSRKYLGKSAVADNVETSQRLRDAARHRKDVLDAERHKTALLNELKGANGPGSAQWEGKLDAVEDLLAKLEKDASTAEGATRAAEVASAGKLRALRQALVLHRTSLEERLREAAGLRALRERLNVWPLPLVGKILGKDN